MASCLRSRPDDTLGTDLLLGGVARCDNRGRTPAFLRTEIGAIDGGVEGLRVGDVGDLLDRGLRGARNSGGGRGRHRYVDGG